MISNVNLIGQGEEVTILDAEETGRVITMEDCDNNTLSDLTITGGLAQGYTANYGGGMYLYSSNPALNNVTISNNTANSGGGMSLYYSNPILTNVTISDNTAEFGGGMYLTSSNPTLTHVTISNNTLGNGSGGGMSLTASHPKLTHVSISGNIAGGGGGGMFLEYSYPTLTYVTIANNIAETQGGGIYSGVSRPAITNSIIWNNNPESIHSAVVEFGAQPLITYSDVEGGWEGEGNIDTEPLFVDPENSDYTLQAESPCIDAGDPSLWYQDLDGSRSDMGITGGSYIDPNFQYHDFGEVGTYGSNKQFTIYNYRETSIIISNISFETSSFTSNTSFPLTIEPLQIGIINIEANNILLEEVQDSMVLISEDLPEGIYIVLYVTGTEENVLMGNLSGTYPTATYRITGDLTIANGDTAYLQAGTEFLFDGEYNFNIYGTLKAIGTENDSIIFDNYDDERWKGFILNDVSDETIFQYVRISKAKKLQADWITMTNNGGGMCLNYSNPILNHVLINDNEVSSLNNGGGMNLWYSSPTLTHVTITGNTANNGGGMRLWFSDPILTNSIIWNNSPQSIYTSSGTPLITYSNIQGGFEGEANIDTDPFFNEDYTLQADSPCIDTGIIMESVEYCGSAPDMGAYEYITEDCMEEECGAELADVNGDSQINILDLVQIANLVLEVSTPDYECAADYNQDGQVNILDLVQIANYILDN